MNKQHQDPKPGNATPYIRYNHDTAKVLRCFPYGCWNYSAKDRDNRIQQHLNEATHIVQRPLHTAEINAITTNSAKVYALESLGTIAGCYRAYITRAEFGCVFPMSLMQRRGFVQIGMQIREKEVVMGGRRTPIDPLMRWTAHFIRTMRFLFMGNLCGFVVMRTVGAVLRRMLNARDERLRDMMGRL